ncbi:MAG TPA: hypothetical protein DEA47_04805 [Peptococcaceae bacterium]|nr:hypothetical protein [Peptococcaceae bacterium]
MDFEMRYNLILSTDDVRVASYIAKGLVDIWGKEKIWARGIVREALEAQEARILTGIRDVEGVPPLKVLEYVRAVGMRFNVDVVAAEIVGDVSLRAVLSAAEQALMVEKIRPSQIRM